MVHDPGPPPGRGERLVEAFPGCQAVVYGHTHIPTVERHRGVWLLNPGSPTERRRGPFHALIVVDVQGGALEPRLVKLP